MLGRRAFQKDCRWLAAVNSAFMATNRRALKKSYVGGLLWPCSSSYQVISSREVEPNEQPCYYLRAKRP